MNEMKNSKNFVFKMVKKIKCIVESITKTKIVFVKI